MTGNSLQQSVSERVQTRLTAAVVVTDAREVGGASHGFGERLPLAAVVQRRRGVDRDHRAVRSITDPDVGGVARLGGDRDRPPEQVFRRDLPERDHEFGVDGGEFAPEVAAAAVEFRARRVTVLRRPAPNTVSDPDVSAGESGVAERVVEDVPRPPHERFAPFVLGGTGGLPHEEQVGIVGADAVDDPRARLHQAGTSRTRDDVDTVGRCIAAVRSNRPAVGHTAGLIGGSGAPSLVTARPSVAAGSADHTRIPDGRVLLVTVRVGGVQGLCAASREPGNPDRFGTAADRRVRPNDACNFVGGRRRRRVAGRCRSVVPVGVAEADAPDEQGFAVYIHPPARR